MRKIVQLAFDIHDNVRAVDNDGKVWLLLGDCRSEVNPLRWERSEWPDLPQYIEEIKNDEN